MFQRQNNDRINGQPAQCLTTRLPKQVSSDAASRNGRSVHSGPSLLSMGLQRDSVFLPVGVPKDEIRQGNPAQKLLELRTEIHPKVMGQASFALLTVTTGFAPGRINGLIHRQYDVGDADVVDALPQLVPPPGPRKLVTNSLRRSRENSCSR